LRANLLPRLDSSIYYSTNKTAVSDKTDVSSKSDGLFYSVSLYQPLFQWGTLKAQSDAAKIGIEVAQKNYAEAYRLLAVSIRQQYAALIVRKASRKIAAEGVRVSQAQLDVEEERLRAGRISAGEVMAPRLAVEEAKLAYERSDADMAQAKRTLSRLTGQPELDDPAIPDTIPISQEYYGADRAAAQLNFFVAAGVDEYLPLQVLQAQIKQADLNYKVAKFRLFPKLAMVGSISQSNQTNASATAVSQVGVNSQNLNVQAIWPIFDGFATSGAKMSALATKRANERQMDVQRRFVLDAARDLELQLRYAARAARLADTRRYLAEDLMKRTEDNLKRGVSTQKEFDGAVAAFNVSDLIAMQQRADLLSRWSDFLSLTGGESALKHVSARYLKNSK
jgi:outer membrane protein TolC